MTAETVLPTRNRLSAASSAAFAGLAYLSFLAVSAYSVPFLAGARGPRTVDAGGPSTGTAAAVVVDALLLTLFALQHSVMARPGFKRRWTQIVPAHLERSCYVLLSSAVLALIFWQWRPIPDVVWDVRASVARVSLWVVYGLGWVLVVAMTFAIDHFDLLGMRQVRRHLRDHPEDAPEFRLPLPYQLVRHPMMTGFMIAFLATPTMTAGHLLFAGLGCGYIVVAVRIEERDLAATLPGYGDYATSTPRFLPISSASRRRRR